MITVVDYGLGNIGSILNMLRRIGVKAESTSEIGKIAEADKLILPGVGSFDSGVESLERMNLLTELENTVLRRRVPTLGICLGAQLLTRGSQEGKRSGLGWIQADTIRFFSQKSDINLPVPNMGWRNISVAKLSPLFIDLPLNPRFYFVHSYHFVCDNPSDVICTADYGYNFTAAFSKDNIYGVQFHPEKSHKFGIKILSNFAAI
jgi:glutamine amidotransferase